MQYDFRKIEEKWQKFWAKEGTFKAENHSEKEKFYVLDMFPYPSGAGLHVGHPLGYIASDIYARYKRHKGFNVLHPMGYDSFGLPAEQYAIQTGQHPAITTEENIKTYRRQLDQLGFSFDWSREIRTSDPSYYKWTQWIFIQLFNSWYNIESDKAEPIENLISIFEKDGNATVKAVCDEDIPKFSEKEWDTFSSKEKQEILLKYRLTYLADADVNWCPALGTVLANDEIVNGVSERGGHPVVRKKMTQWMMRITAYAQRLLDGLDKIDWPQPLKESQRNWIGRSVGAEVSFRVLPLAPSEGGGTPSLRDGSSSPADGLSAHVLPLAPSLGGGRPSRQQVDSSTDDGLSAFDEERVASRLTGDSSIIGTLLNRAKEMRKNPTKAEAKLWEVLRKKDFVYKFRRQHPIYKYIVDFVCLDKGLIVEVDGEIHQHQLDKDAGRQLELEAKKGFKVLRFSNEEVLKDIQSVKIKIREELDRLPSKNEINEEKASSIPYGQIETKGGSLPAGEGWGGDLAIEVFTTRPDTIFGVSFMTLAPEHELVSQITTPQQKEEVEAYIEATAKRSERDRMADVKTITGAFTGAYAEHPFTKEPVPIWIGDYVLAGYGTGAVMSVPCGDQRDYDFAKHFGIDIPNIFKGIDISEEAFADKEKTVITNSDFLNGMPYKKAVKKAIAELETLGQGEGKINYRLRDAVFSRQRYWGEPFPVYYVDGMPQMIADEHLPIKLPEVEKYLPTATGEPPLGNATEWAWDVEQSAVVSNQLIEHKTVFPLELNTMPGWAGSSQYFNRYMDPHNDEEIFSQEAINYWQDVDLYIGGSEHATGHLLYSRFWQKFMFDKGLVPKDEYAKKLINQGMITGTSAFVYRIVAYYSSDGTMHNLNLENLIFISKAYVLKSSKSKNEIVLRPEDFIYTDVDYEILEIIQKSCKDELKDEPDFMFVVNHTDVNFVNSSNELDIEAFKKWRPEYEDATFILEDGKIYQGNSLPPGEGRGGDFIVSREVEKMSKSKYNVVNPDAICEEYGADSLRMYEMFLGPLEQSKPWNTAGITGVHGFLKKLWKLYHSSPNGEFMVTSESLPTGGEQLKGNSPSPGGGRGEDPLAQSLKTLHKTIKKVEDDIKTFSFNTSVSTFMICVNELTAQKCTSKEILEPLTILVSPYAPHIAEELWERLGHTESIATAPFPNFEEKYLVERSKEYPISFNGKMRFTMELALDLDKHQIEEAVMAHEKTQQQLDGRTPKKVIVVPGKIVNIVG